MTGDGETEGPSMTALVERYLDERVSMRTLNPMSARNHRSTLGHFALAVGDVAPDDLTVEDIETWLGTRFELAPASRRGQFSHVKTFCGWLVKHGHAGSNPATDVDSPRQPRSVPRALPEKAVRSLLRACPDTRGRAMVWLMVGMGLRCREVAAIEVGDWDAVGQIMLVKGKGGHQRELPVPPEVAEALRAYLAEYPASAGPLMRSFRHPSNPLCADTISGMVSEWLRAAKVKRVSRDGVSAHALRHTAASDVLDACQDLRVVQEMLGHQQLATTSIYLRRAGLGQMRKAMGGRRYEGIETEPDGSAA